MCTASGPGTASEAAAWASGHDLTNGHAWADTTDYLFTNFLSGGSIGGSYPSTMIIDVDTMEMTYLSLGGLDAAESAIQAITSAEHPCADY